MDIQHQKIFSAQKSRAKNFTSLPDPTKKKDF